MIRALNASRSPAFLVAVVAAASLGCAAGPKNAPPDAPIAAVLAVHGEASAAPGVDRREVVLIRDRHYVGDGITFVDEDLRAIQRVHRALIADLADRGFTILGAEWRHGPLPTDDLAETHRERTKELLEKGEDLNRWSVYQPIRYEVEFGPRLTVVGVEDSGMYDADVAALTRLLELSRLARRTDTSRGPTVRELAEERLVVRRGMRARIDPRGAAAAVNLLAEMDAREASRGILLVGGAHIPAAAAALAERGVAHFIFTAPAFDRRTPTRPLHEG